MTTRSAPPETSPYDVIVVGGGAAGLSAAQVLGRQRRRVLVVDGGQPRNRPAAEMHMYLSRDGLAPSELLSLGRDELRRYPSVQVRPGQVTGGHGSIDDFSLSLSTDPQHDDETAAAPVVCGRRVLLATGQQDVPYDIPGLSELFGSAVYHCPFCHGWESTGATLAVVTHDPMEVMLALYLRDRFSDDVVLCSDGPIEIHPTLSETAARHGVGIETRRISSVSGVPGEVLVTFEDGGTLRRDGVFHRAPTRQHSDLAATLGCEILADGVVRIDEFQATSVPGVSAAGDLARLPQVPEPATLVSQAAADGVRAAVWMEMGLFRSDLGVSFPLPEVPVLTDARQ